VQQSSIESLLLGLAGGAVGLMLAWGLVRLLVKIAPAALSTKADRAAAQDAVILGASLARRIFGNENAVGQQIALQGYTGAQTIWSPIVGVAADVKNSGLAATPEPEYYRVRTWKSSQLGRSAVAIFRTSLQTENLARMIRRELATLDPALPVNIQSMPQRISELSERPRFVTVLIGLFAAFGLLLAPVGLYGVMSFLVSHQTREIGVRMAIGATPYNIAALMLTFASRWTLLGLLLGLIGSLFVTRLARGILFETSPQDPRAFGTAAAVLLSAALLAAWLPSFRASRIEPAISLRHE
jgi:ABC-type antimicrobial peptide transport system permease subunit